MVVIDQAVEPVLAVQQQVMANELRLASNRCLRYVAPLVVDISPVAGAEQFIIPAIKRTEFNQLNDSYEGVSEFCKALDDLIEIEKDTELLVGKQVLEIGFATGIPSLFALDCGANEVTVHSFDKLTIDTCIQPSLRRNNVPQTMYKFTTGDLQSCIQNLNKTYDVILAPEFIMADEDLFGDLHSILEAALSPNGIILLSGRSHYSHCSGSIVAFLELVKMRGCFDAHIRWTSPSSEVGSRKLIQMTRCLR
ncbi:hypothetical protein M3Y94_00380300 [Aphelenchoides besseyi]|nr:hypothetical protein M3Y94_00380300 [Aphelenchoides besseyi]KAI6235092.1 hypothetical protein M3Y95_00014600 [Aphelenchoides besseyi]